MINKSKEYSFFCNLLDTCCGKNGLLHNIREFEKNNTYYWFKKNNRNNEEILVKKTLFILIENSVSILSSLDTLIRARNVTGINALARMMIENFVFFSSIDDSSQKHLIAKRYIIGSEMNTCKKQLDSLGKIEKENAAKNTELIAEYEFWYSEWKKYQPIKLTKNGKNAKLKWYGERNFKDLCEKKDFIGLEDYEIYDFYKLFSIEVHNLNPSMAISNESCDYDYSQKEMVISIISLINWMMFITVKRATQYIDFDLKSATTFNSMQVKIYSYRKYYGVNPFNTIEFDDINNKFKRVYKE